MKAAICRLLEKWIEYEMDADLKGLLIALGLLVAWETMIYGLSFADAEFLLLASTLIVMDFRARSHDPTAKIDID
jgi:hypothetical protein